jgi:hypothetical protein
MRRHCANTRTNTKFFSWTMVRHTHRQSWQSPLQSRSLAHSANWLNATNPWLDSISEGEKGHP